MSPSHSVLAWLAIHDRALAGVGAIEHVVRPVRGAVGFEHSSFVVDENPYVLKFVGVADFLVRPQGILDNQ